MAADALLRAAAAAASAAADLVGPAPTGAGVALASAARFRN